MQLGDKFLRADSDEERRKEFVIVLFQKAIEQDLNLEMEKELNLHRMQVTFKTMLKIVFD